MGYFSNGTEGHMYEVRYCQRCIHYDDCPILVLHMLWNYEQHGDDELSQAKKMALGMLIPVKGTVNEECTMFVQDNCD